MTYLNTSFFAICLIPRLASGAYRHQQDGTLVSHLQNTFTVKTLKLFFRKEEQQQYLLVQEEESFLKPNGPSGTSTKSIEEDGQHLDLISTARYSLAFCLLWFLANYFAMACLQYTTVASTTILTSTSSIWTLIFGSFTGTEKFTWKKLCGVLASLAGIALISQVDLKSGDKAKRAIDEFPEKTAYELALGDALALLSAAIYGVYTIVLKRTTLSALPKSLHMPTFFGFVGIFNLVVLFPIFPILHLTGLETFTLPPTPHIWMILLVNSTSSLISDICWAYAMVFTSPLVVTVGLSLTIPLSLVGEMIIQARFESWVYWVGAMIVVGSFVFVEREEKHEEVAQAVQEEDFGEPGPAILIEDYDEMMEQMERQRNRSESFGSLMDDDILEDEGSSRAIEPQRQ